MYSGLCLTASQWISSVLLNDREKNWELENSIYIFSALFYTYKNTALIQIEIIKSKCFHRVPQLNLSQEWRASLYTLHDECSIIQRKFILMNRSQWIYERNWFVNWISFSAQHQIHVRPSPLFVRTQDVWLVYQILIAYIVDAPIWNYLKLCLRWNYITHLC